jgi:hypothetical protein
VVNPPRLRPRASQSPATSPFFRAVLRGRTGRGASGTRGVLVGPDGGAVHADEFPVQSAGLVRLALEGGEDLMPDALPFPALEAVVTGTLGPIASGQVFPLGTGAQDPEDPIDDLAVIAILTTSPPVRTGEQGGDPFPFLIGEVSTCHSGPYLPRKARIHRMRPSLRRVSLAATDTCSDHPPPVLPPVRQPPDYRLPKRR